MRRPTAAAVALMLLASACAGEGTGTGRGGSGAEDTSPIRIGVVGPMTGLASFVGKNMKEGIQLAVDDINEAGGLLGRHVEFVERDDEYDPSKTTTAVRELIEREEVVALFGPASTSTYLSVARTVQDSSIPTWVIMAGPELTDSVNPSAFRAYLPDRIQIKILVEYASSRYDRIAVLAGNEAEGEAFRNEAADALREAGKPAVAVEAFSQDETDFSPIMLKIKQSRADALILGTHLGLYASRAVTAMKNLDFDPQVLGVAGLVNYTYPDLARGAADGSIFVSFRNWSHLPADQWPSAVRAFYDRYVETYLPDGERSATGAYRAYSTNFLTYDMVRIWASAVAKAGSAEPADVVKVLNTDFSYPADDSVIGVSYRYSSTDHDGIEPGDLYMYRWTADAEGKFNLDVLGSVTDVLAGRAGV